MAKITVRRTGHITVDRKALEKRLVPLILGWVKNRTHEGRDVDDNPFAGYSSSYRRTLGRMGESGAVDLRLTGGLLGSLRHVRTETSSARLMVLVFGVGTGSSPAVRAPSKGRARAQRTGRRGPSHALVAMWLHRGTSVTPPRRWLGLGRGGEKMAARALGAMPVFRG